MNAYHRREAARKKKKQDSDRERRVWTKINVVKAKDRSKQLLADAEIHERELDCPED